MVDAQDSQTVLIGHSNHDKADMMTAAKLNANKVHSAGDCHSRNEVYNNWANKYDEELSIERYRGPYYIAQNLIKHLGEQKNARILDVAGGTGILAEHLRNAGYFNCDVLDPSEGMLDRARMKNIYVKYYCSLLGENKEIQDDTYDGLCMAGGFGPGHIPCKPVMEMIRLVKPGGIICLGIRSEFLIKVDEYRDRLVPMFRELEAAGYWRLLEEVHVNDWFIGFPGTVWVYQVTTPGLPPVILSSIS